MPTETTLPAEKVELLPCPFCASPTVQVVEREENWYGECYRKGCSITVELTDCDTEAEAVQQWNTRVTAQPTPASATREQGAPERIYLPADTDADAWNVLAKNPSRDWSTGEPANNIAYVHGDRHAKAIEALRGVAIMLNTELKQYKDEPWAKAVAAALHPE